MATANGQKQLDFTPVDFDASSIPPDAPAGEWTATCSVKKLKTQKDGYPMLALEWKLEDTDEEEHKTFLGASVTDFIVFFPEGSKASKPGKQRLRKLCDHMDIDLDVLPPGRLSSWDDLKDFIEALDKQRATIWTVVKTDAESNESRTNVLYSKPGGSFSRDEDDEEEAAPKGKTAAKGAKGGKSARR